MTTEQEIQDAIRKLKKLGKHFDKKKKQKILRKASKPMVKAAKAKVPVASRPVHRYKDGKRVATYLPGNLRNAIRGLVFRRSEALFIGPRKRKRDFSGMFGRGNRVDGWYGHYVEFGTRNSQAQPFMRPAYDSTKNIVMSNIRDEVLLEIKKIETKN